MEDERPETQEPPGEAALDQVSLARIQSLLQARDDTQRFVGLALLKSVLDNSPQLREDEEAVQGLWSSLSAKFLSRLLNSGSRTASRDSQQMLVLAVSILHTFSILLPEKSRGDVKFTARIPGLVAAVLHSSEETTKLILQLLFTLVSSNQGAAALVQVEDLTPLTEIAPSHAIVMDILSFAWLTVMATGEDRAKLSRHINSNIQNLASSFTGTDAVTFLEFLAAFLRRADHECIPRRPTWLKTAVGFIRNLVSSRPTPEARAAYTSAAAALLQAYPDESSQLLFNAEREADKPTLSYLLINLLLIDIRSSAPVLLEQLNQPGYAQTSRRLASAFDVVCIFIGHLVKSFDNSDDDDDDDDDDSSLERLIMSPDHLLKLRRGISETMSVTVEYLRDRWDASFAGAMGLHPDARTAAAQTSSGSRRTLAWDSREHAADQDPLVLAAVRALALWLREDENETLRKEASGLTDMLLELYQGSRIAPGLDFRSPALVAMEALVTFEKGRDILLRNGAWRVLGADLNEMLQRSGAGGVRGEDAARGVELVRVLLQMVEQTGTSTAEEWMDTVTRAAAWDVFGAERQRENEEEEEEEEEGAAAVVELQIAILQLCCALLFKASDGMRRRYTHSTSALVGIATQLEATIPGEDGFFRESIEDVLNTLRGLSSRR